VTDDPGKHPTLTHLSRSCTDVGAAPQAGTLEAFENSHPGRDYWITFDCPEFTSLCPITGQPDFGHITIRYIPDTLCLESKSLKLYMFSFRNHGTFHEEVINRILDDVIATIAPRQAVVRGEFNPRGGIAIIVEAATP
jgi:7-cyano-7-deazaguanine reductase